MQITKLKILKSNQSETKKLYIFHCIKSILTLWFYIKNQSNQDKII